MTLTINFLTVFLSLAILIVAIPVLTWIVGAIAGMLWAFIDRSSYVNTLFNNLDSLFTFEYEKNIWVKCITDSRYTVMADSQDICTNYMSKEAAESLARELKAVAKKCELKLGDSLTHRKTYPIHKFKYSLHRLWPFTFAAAIVLIVTGTLLQYAMWPFLYVCGAAGVLFLARSSRDLAKKLTAHMEDLAAHKRTKEYES